MLSRLERLRCTSREFADLWDTCDVAIRRSERKRIAHPELGVIEIDLRGDYAFPLPASVAGAATRSWWRAVMH